MVIDVGSMWTRIGKANSETPEIIERTMIGDLRRTLTNKEQTYYGNDVANKSGNALKYFQINLSNLLKF
jgi:actin-related protein